MHGMYGVGGRRMKYGCGAAMEWYWQGKFEVLGENPISAQLCAPHIPHGLARSLTKVSGVWGRRKSLLRRICGPGSEWQDALENYTWISCVIYTVQTNTNMAFRGPCIVMVHRDVFL